MRPCSADSSRKLGPSPRSFRKAETGVSQSSTNDVRTGIAFPPSRASSRARSRLGSTSTPSSAATAIERLEHGRQRDTAREQEDLQVVEDVGGLVREPLGGLGVRRARDLLGLLPNLGADPRRIVEQLDRVRALGALVAAL